MEGGTEETGKWVAPQKTFNNSWLPFERTCKHFPRGKIVHNKKAEKLMKKGTTLKLKVWVNTTLAEVWEEKAKRLMKTS
nr:hypothetical protein [Paenibacillus larvae]